MTETLRRSVLSQPDFRRFWTADLLSQLGARLGLLAVPLLAVLELNASAFEVSLLRAFETAAWLLIGLFAGAWMDRIRCRPVLIASDLARAALFGSIPIAAAYGVLTLTQLYVVLFLAGVMTVMFDVAHSTYLPRLVDREDLVAGNAKLAANHSVGAVAGQGIGGYLVQWSTAPVAIGVNALGFIWSALWLRSIRAVEARPMPAEQPHLRREIGAGLRFVVRHPRAIWMAAVANGIGFLLVPMAEPGWRIGFFVLGNLVISFSIIVAYILQASARQLLCPAELNGRVSATMSFLTWGAMPVGSVLGGVLATTAGLRATLWITAGAILLSAGWLLLSPYRRLRDLPSA